MRNPSLEQYRQTLLDKLPPIVTRRQGLDAIGNLYSPRTLSNMESRKEGPRSKLRIGRQVAYSREDFVDFIIGKISEANAHA